MHNKSKSFPTSFRAIAGATIFTFALFNIVPTPAFAFDVTVSEGDATVTKDGDVTTVNLGSKAILEGNTSILENEVVKFVGSSDALLRDLTGSQTQWIGSLIAEGKIILVNTNGVYIADAAKINVSSLIASTLNIQNELFLTNQLSFEKVKGANSAEILNKANIQVADGGYIVLLADKVENQGKLTAYLGSVALGSGEKMTLSFDQQGLVNLVVDKGLENELKNPDGSTADQIVNKGEIHADGGRVQLTAKLLKTSLNQIVNNEGVIQAGHAVERDGVVELVADGGVTTQGSLVTDKLFERGANFKVSGNLAIKNSDIKNLDHAMTFNSDTTLSGTFEDLENIEINSEVIITLAGDTTFWADRDMNGIGSFLMDPTAIIDGQGHDLTLRAGQDSNSTIGVLQNIHQLTLQHSSVNNITFEDEAVLFNSGTNVDDIDVDIFKTAVGAVFSKVVGVGSEEDPYLIYDLSQLHSLDGYSQSYKLANDIDATASENYYRGSGFLPIGYGISSFSGIFDGDNHTISNLTIGTGDSDSSIGLFSALEDATVKNLNLADVYVFGGNYVGGVVGSANNSTIDNVFVSGVVEQAFAPFSGVGGIAGAIFNGSVIQNSHSSAEIIGSINAGGLVGAVYYNSIVDNSYATGAVRSVNNGGGLVGFLTASSIIEDSHASGNVTIWSTTGGGLVGQVEAGSVVSTSYATGQVGHDDFDADQLGGLVGVLSESQINQSYSTGDVIANDGDQIGGLVGYSYDSIIADTFSNSQVTGSTQVGGLVGKAEFGEILRSYSAGAVTATGSDVGGLIGANYGSTTIQDNFSVSSLSGGASHVGGIIGYDNDDGASLGNNYWHNIVTDEIGDVSGSGPATYDTWVEDVTEFFEWQGAVFSGWDISADIFSNTVWGGSWGFNSLPLLTFRMPALDEDDVYQITDAYQLQLMNLNLSGAYELANDIEASETARWNPDGEGNYFGFAPVGKAVFGPSFFTGNFEGSNHSISGLFIDRQNEQYNGLFSFIAGATVKNLTLNDITVHGNTIDNGSWWGAGALAGIGIYGGFIDNVAVTGDSEVSGGASVGGLIGSVGDSFLIQNSHSTAAVSGVESVGGLVGYTSGDSRIENSYASGNVIGASYSVGGLVGALIHSIVRSSHASGEVRGGFYDGEDFVADAENVGGLVGYNSYYSVVENSYATGDVYGRDDVGGLTGENDNDATVRQSYASGDVTATLAGGGLSGWNDGYSRIENSYATGSVTGTQAYVEGETDGSQVGGLVGVNEDGSVIVKSYASGTVSSQSVAGGLVGLNQTGATVTESFWNRQTTGQNTSSGSIDLYGRTTALMHLKDTFSSEGWDFNGLWSIDSGETPHFIWQDMIGGGTELNPWEITNANELQFMQYDLSGYFVLENDIDASSTQNWNYDLTSNSHLGFKPVGDDDIAAFTGNFNGQNHVISELYINRPDTNYVGLFGETYNAEIANVGLENISVTGSRSVGGLIGDAINSFVDNVHVTNDEGVLGVVGDNDYVGGVIGFALNTTIEDSFSLLNVYSTGLHVGGFVGSLNQSSVDRSFSMGSVQAPGYVGGFAGSILDNSAVDNSYSTASVTSDGGIMAAGFVGYLDSNATINHSYSTGVVTGSSGMMGGFVGYAGVYQISNSWTVSYPNPTDEQGGVGGFVGSSFEDHYTNNWYYNNYDSFSIGDGERNDAGISYDINAGFSNSGHDVYNGMDPWLFAISPADDDISHAWFITNGMYPLLRFRYSTTVHDATQLQLIAMDTSADYTLANDIDASNTAFANAYGDGSYFGFMPIFGFTGTFDGQGHVISGLTMTRPENGATGLFELTDGARIKNVGLADVDITGGSSTGALVGTAINGTVITNTYATGIVRGQSYVGGLVGTLYGYSEVDNSYTNITVTAEDHDVGGLIGQALASSTVRHSYSAGSVTSTGNDVGGLIGFLASSTLAESFSSAAVSGDFRVGGLIGMFAASLVTDTYASGAVTATGHFGGGLIGEASYGGEIDNSFAFGYIDVAGQRGGLIGFNNGGSVPVNNSYWDMDATGLDFTDHDLGVGLNTADLKDADVFPGSSGWDFNGLWSFDTTNDGYPHLIWQDMKNSTDFIGGTELAPWKISDVHELQFMDYALNDDFILTQNIDASATSGWNSGAGFSPIWDGDNAFTGTFDGQSYTITGLFIDRPQTDVGLFGETFDATIRDVDLVDVNISGHNNTGALIGRANRTTIMNASSSGTVTGYSNVGGLVGNANNATAVSDSHSSADVTGEDGGSANYAGGLVGYLTNYSTIDNSYATGDVQGDNSVGGFVGENYGRTIITDSYATGNVSGINNVGGFAGWVGDDSDRVYNSYATGDVSGISKVGGFGGLVDEGVIQNAFSLGNVTGHYRVGGFGGHFADRTIVENVYATGNVTGLAMDLGEGLENATRIGGFAGEVDNALIVNSFSINNSVIGDDQVGGFVGYDNYNNTYINNYFFSGDDLDSVGASADVFMYTTATSAATASDFFNGEHVVYTNNDAQISWDIATTNNGSDWGVSGRLGGLPLLQFRYSTSIHDAVQLQLMHLNLDTDYTIANDFDAAITQKMNPNGEGGYFGFEPVGFQNDVGPDQYFTGSLDGQSHEISNLFIHRSVWDLGLFGEVDGATIQNIGLSNVDIYGNSSSVGGLVGYVGYGTTYIDNAYVTGSVTGGDWTGGLVGGVDSTVHIKNSYSLADVQGSNEVGGLIGSFNGTIRNSYASGNVNGNTQVGGLVGFSVGNIYNSYASGEVIGSIVAGGFVGYLLGTMSQSFSKGDVQGSEAVGGFAGANYGTISDAYSWGDVVGNGAITDVVGGFVGYSNGTIQRAYSFGEVTGTGNRGGFAGQNDGGTNSDSFYRTEPGFNEFLGAVNLGDGSGIAAKTTAELDDVSLYSNAGWDVNGLWKMDGDGHAVLMWEGMMDMQNEANFGDFIGGTEVHPWQIDDVNELQFMNYAKSDYFVLSGDIDASATSAWNEALGFDPIGEFESEFLGTFDGQDYVISGLSINRSEENNIGLFGYTLNATIKNVGLSNVDMSGLSQVGSLAGSIADTIIENVFVESGDVVGVNGEFEDATNIGGLIGKALDGSIIRGAYSSANVIGYDNAGGLVGRLSEGSRIEDSYATGTVEGFSRTGGLIGLMEEEAIVEDSYATGNVTGDFDAAGFAGAIYDGGTIRNSYATGEVHGANYVGGLGGYFGDNSVVENSYATGNVTGTENYVGGLIGSVSGEGSGNLSILRSYAKGAVSGSSYVGGLVGQMFGSQIFEAYATGSVEGLSYVGGLVGEMVNGSLILNAYATGAVSAVGDASTGFGGLVGYMNSSFVLNTYATGDVDGYGSTGGLIGIVDGTGSIVENSFETGVLSNNTNDYGGFIGEDTNLGENNYNNNWGTFSGATYEIGNLEADASGIAVADENWFFDSSRDVFENWSISSFNDGSVWAMTGYSRALPMLQFRYSTDITDAYQLQLMNLDLTADYTLHNDVDASETANWNFGLGFEPVGPNDERSAYNFTGTLDGQNHIVTGLTIDRASEEINCTGLFGITVGARIHSLGLTDVNISGFGFVGGLVGFAAAGTNISQVFVTGAVTGSDNDVGGLLGYLSGSRIENSYSLADVNGANYVGGLVGVADSSDILYSFSGGEVTSGDVAGGFVGIDFDSNFTANFFENTKNFGLMDTGSGDRDGIAGAVTSDLKNRTIFEEAGWDIDETPIWDVYDGESYPHLHWENYTVGVTSAYWTGAGMTLLWSDTDNWLDGILPGVGINVVFDGDTGHYGQANKLSVVDQDFTIGNFTVSGYTGIISVFANLIVSGNFTQNTGTIVETVAFDGVSDIKQLAISGAINFDSENSSFYGSVNDTNLARRITNIVELQDVSQDLTQTYIFADDIDASATESWNDGAGFNPIGDDENNFNGVLIGMYDISADQGFQISNLFINHTHEGDSQYVGLFGFVGEALIENLAIVGTDSETTYIQGFGGEGDDGVGAVAGYNSGVIRNVFTNIYVSGLLDVGGIAGYNNGLIENSEVQGNTYAAEGYAGSLAGYNSGTILSSISSGNVAGNISIGGLVGSNQGIIQDSYFIGNVLGESLIGGIAGVNNGTIDNSYYDIDTVNINDAHRAMRHGIYSSQFSDWQGGDRAELEVGDYLTLNGDYYEIADLTELKEFLAFADRSESLKFKITSDIDLTGAPEFMIPHLKVLELNGDEHAISNISIDHSSINNNNVGFIGFNEFSAVTLLSVAGDISSGGENTGGLIGFNSQGLVSNNMANVNVTSTSATSGGLIGYNLNGTVMENTVQGDVSGVDTVGGAVGLMNGGNLVQSFVSGSVSGDEYVGGLVGYSSNATIMDSYSTGSVVANDYMGGLIGGEESSSITNSYYDISTAQINGQNRVTKYGIYGDQFTDWQNGNYVALDIDDYFTQNGSGYYEVNFSDDLRHLLPFVNVDGSDALKFTLTRDVDLDGIDNFMIPVLNVQELGFGGSLISNLNLDMTGFDNVGFIGVNRSTLVSGLHLVSSVVVGRNSVGGLVGSHSGTTLTSGSFSGDVTGEYQTGGLVGVNFGTITNSFADATVQGGNETGGFVGENIGGTIEDSSSIGATVNGLESTGGFVGANLDATIARSYSTASVSGTNLTGGFVGFNQNYNDGSISENYATGNVEGAGRVGGFVGYNYYGVIHNSYAKGDVTGNSNDGIYEAAGGFVGMAYLDTIDNSYATGMAVNLLNPSNAGGFAGQALDGTYSHNFYNSTANAGGSAGVGVSFNTMKTKSLYVSEGWDTATTPIWDVYKGMTPHLHWEGVPMEVHSLAGQVYDAIGGVALANVVVKLISDGFEFDSVTADGAGAFTFTDIGFAGGTSVLFYISGDAIQGNTLIHDAGIGGMSGINIYGGAVTVGEISGTALANTDFGNVLGSLVDSDILFSISDSDLSVSEAATFYIAEDQTFISGGNLTVGDLRIETDATLNTGNNTVTVSGDWTNQGTFNAGMGTVRFVGTTSTIHIDNSGTGNFYDVVFDSDGYVTTYTLESVLNLDSHLTIASGTLDVSANNYAINMIGSWTNNGGTFNARNGVVTMSGAGQTIRSAGAAFYQLAMVGGYVLYDALTVSDNLDVSAGTLNADGYAVFEGGNWGNDEFANISNLGDVTLTGASKTITSGANSFGNLTVSGSYALADALTAAGELDVSEGTLDAANHSITEAGHWTSDQLENITNLSDVILNGTGKTIASNGNSFASTLTVDGSYTLEDNLSLGGNLAVNGALDADGNEISEGGDWGTDEFSNISNLGDVVLTGISKSITSGANSFGNLTINGSYLMNDGLTVTGNLGLGNASTLDADNNQISEGGDWVASQFDHITNMGDITLTGTNKAIESDNTSFVGNLTITGSYQLDDALSVDGNLDVDDGALDAQTFTITESGDWASSEFINISNLGGVTLAGTGKIISSDGHHFNGLTLTGSYTLANDLRVDDELDISAGTLDAGGFMVSEGGNWGADEFNNISNLGLVSLTGSGKIITSGGEAFSTLIISGSYTLADELHTTGNLVMTNGSLDVSANNYQIDVDGDWSSTDSTFSGHDGTVVFNGIANSIQSGGIGFSNVQILGNYSLVDDFVVGELDVLGGTLDANSKTIYENGNWEANEFTNISNLGDVFLTGVGQSITSGGGEFGNLTIWGNYTVNDDLTVNGNFSIETEVEGSFDANGQDMTIAGNWMNNGTFTHGNNLVTFNGSNQLIQGTTTFYDFTKTVGVQDQLTFEAGTLQVFEGTLTLQGGLGGNLLLRSSVDGTQWNLDTAAVDMNYIDIKDTNNVGTTIDLLLQEAIDSGNNTHWLFLHPFTLPVTSPNTQSYNPSNFPIIPEMVIPHSNLFGLAFINPQENSEDENEEDQSPGTQGPIYGAGVNQIIQAGQAIDQNGTIEFVATT